MEQKGRNSPSGPEVRRGGSGFNAPSPLLGAPLEAECLTGLSLVWLDIALEARESHPLDRFHTPVPRKDRR